MRAYQRKRNGEERSDRPERIVVVQIRRNTIDMLCDLSRTIPSKRDRNRGQSTERKKQKPRSQKKVAVIQYPNRIANNADEQQNNGKMCNKGMDVHNRKKKCFNRATKPLQWAG